MSGVSTVYITLCRLGEGGLSCCVMNRVVRTKFLLDEVAAVVCMLADGTEMTVSLVERADGAVFEYELKLKSTPETRRGAAMHERAIAHQAVAA